VKILLQEAGLESDRVEMYNIGASDAVKFATACNEMTERAKSLGPNPLGKKEAAEVK
jgi:coenzyme F420-reducing hydrogenase delta subunit